MGIEILLHDLANPSRSIVWIESAEVTGRSLHMGTTTLLVDLKKRRAINESVMMFFIGCHYMKDSLWMLGIGDKPSNED